MKLRSESGFTLIELMVAVVVLGILAAIAIPNYSAYVNRGKRAAAKTVLIDTANRLERNYTTNGCYGQTTVAACQAGSGAPITAAGDALAYAPTEGRAQYRIDISNGGAQTYTLTATPCGNAGANCPVASETHKDADCGSLTLTHTGARGLSDASGNAITNATTIANCWQR